MNIIFDLDGTLIDSSAGILRAVELAFNSCNIEMKLPLSNDLVGPPLLQLLEMLSGLNNQQVLEHLADEFKQSYDSEGYKETEVFNGIEVLLKQLNQHGMKLFIATNKRMIPTQKILEHFSWNDYFTGVYALDTCDVAENKTQLISYVIKQHKLERDKTIYVGDTVPDRHSALANELRFIMVSWGYEFSVGPGDEFVQTSAELHRHLSDYCP